MRRASLGATTARKWPYYPDLLATPVPRYTSFPTAAEFSDAVGLEDLDRELAQISGDISLYVHIPFCEKICWYCGCNTGASNWRERLVSYLDALRREIGLIRRRIAGRAQVRRVAFGGGSPNAISPTDFVGLVTDLTTVGTLVGPVWSIELDPRSLCRDWGRVIAGVGITHASLGVQTLEPHLQAAIGRVQPREAIVAATGMLRRCGITSLNFDLMYGLPGQTLDDLRRTLEQSVALEPDRIALFGYAHVPHLIKRQERIDDRALPGQRLRFAMAEAGHELLTAAGYRAIGFDHFALPGDALAQAAEFGRLRRNFQGFTDDASPVLLGLGASAISIFPDAIIQNEKNAGRYRMRLSQQKLPAALGVRRSAQDITIAELIERLLCQGEASLGAAMTPALIEALDPFVERGLAGRAGDVLTILPAGLPYARTIAALLDPYRQDSTRRFSSAV
jgi:oxygen-independent coproporphyrinogen-3 oxidase